ncbi:MAG: hypothetical protein J0653_01360, partial [Deltaproteobacteria bacterium]|nr:hypothetical protein [Deltaproteobacteria bacterium]
YNYYLIVVAIFTMISAYVARLGLGIGSSISLVGFLLIIPLFIYSINWNSTIVPALNMFDYSFAFVAFSTVSLFLGLVFSALLTLFYSKTAIGWVSGQLLGTMIVTICAVLYVIKKDLITIKKEKLVLGKIAYIRLLKFSLPLALATGGIWLQQQSYRLVVEKLKGGSALAQLSVGFAVAASISSAVEAIATQIAGPRFYSQITSDKKEDRDRAWYEYASFLVPIYLITFMYIVNLAKPLMLVLIGSSYHNSFTYVVWGALIELLRVVNNVISNAAHAEYRTERLIVPYLTGGSIVLFGTWLLIASTGSMQYLPAVIVFSGIVVMVLILFSVRRVSVLSIDLKGIIKTIILSIPLLIFKIFSLKEMNILSAIIVCSFAGLYYLFIFTKLVSTKKNILSI